MFNTSIFSQHPRKEHRQEKIDPPFGTEIFAMMAASTFGIAYGGPNRMFIEQEKPNTSTNTIEATPAPALLGIEGVKGWFLYDPKTEDFRPSSEDEEKEEEQVAAQTLVDLCEEALAPPMTHGGDVGLMRSSFSFVVRKESVGVSPCASPLNNGEHGTANLTSTKTGDGHWYQSRREMSVASLDVVNGGLSPLNDNCKTARMMPLPPLRETRLGSHRGSVMEAGVVLDTRVFGGIGVVQKGRHVGVSRSEGGVTPALRG
jgi:hypothetical protein